MMRNMIFFFDVANSVTMETNCEDRVGASTSIEVLEGALRVAVHRKY